MTFMNKGKCCGSRGVVQEGERGSSELIAANRSKRYGINESLSEDLVVSRNEVVRLTSVATNKYASYLHGIRADSLDALKALVGIEDAVSRKISATGCQLPFVDKLKNYPLVSKEFAAKQTGRGGVHDFRGGARAAIKGAMYGDTETYLPFLKMMEELILVNPIVIVIGLFNNIVVENGATLEIGKDVSVLDCNKLIIKQDGCIVAHGNLTIRAVSAQGNVM